jgi:hypothetical protein
MVKPGVSAHPVGFLCLAGTTHTTTLQCETCLTWRLLKFCARTLAAVVFLLLSVATELWRVMEALCFREVATVLLPGDHASLLE